jgi:hypothetical protein
LLGRQFVPIQFWAAEHDSNWVFHLAFVWLGVKDLTGGPEDESWYEHPDRKDIRYVAFLDVLGFSKLAEKSLLRDLVATLDDILFTARLHSGEFTGESVSYEGFVEGPKKVHLRLMSDAIVIWTNGSSKSDFRSLQWAVGQIVAQSILSGFPLRGGISAGPLHVAHDGDIIAGAALVQAYRLEQAQNWAGVAIDGWADFEADEETPNSIGRGILNYDPPTKEPTKMLPLVVDWPIHVAQGVDWDDIQAVWPTCTSAAEEQKLAETRKFFEFANTCERDFKLEDVRPGGGFTPRAPG